MITTLADEERGLILVTGTTGSGKSTTLAAMIDHINSTYAKHIVTIEDPAEFLHRDKRCIINQREVGEDTVSFARALRRVLRQDPDVILIGEMRDEETVRTALSAAETGHLVLSTIHTVDASESVNRIIDFFPQAEQKQARAMLAGTLKGVISQRLVPTPDGTGRVATCEVLRMTGRVRDMIMNPDDTGRLPEVIAEGALLRHAELRPGPAPALPGGPHLDGGGPEGGHPSARLQAPRGLRRHALHLVRERVRRRARTAASRPSTARPANTQTDLHAALEAHVAGPVDELPLAPPETGLDAEVPVHAGQAGGQLARSSAAPLGSPPPPPSTVHELDQKRLGRAPDRPHRSG